MSSVKGGGGHSDPNPRGPGKELMFIFILPKIPLFFSHLNVKDLLLIVLSVIQHFKIVFDSMILKKLLNF